MPKYYYQRKSLTLKRFLRFLALIFLTTGLIICFYTFFPLISWQIYFAPVFASQNFATPIPKTTVLTGSQINSLLESAKNNFVVDYTNAQNWFPNFYSGGSKKSEFGTYNISIPAIDVKNAVVSTSDNNLAIHLVNYQGTAVPPDKGNAVIFGHSTLPQLFNPKDYKTIFANAYKLKIGDEIFVEFPKVTYKYKIYSIYIVNADDTSPLEQNYNDNNLTLITCTPPGTTWKRLIIKAKIQEI